MFPESSGLQSAKRQPALRSAWRRLRALERMTPLAGQDSRSLPPGPFRVIQSRAGVVSLISLGFSLGITFALWASAAQAAWNLSGTWKGVGGVDGTYTISQSGTTVTWSGHADDGHSWANDFTGKIETNNDIVGTFADRPGYDVHQQGSVTVHIDDNCHLSFVSASVGWGTQTWTKENCTAAPAPATPSPAALITGSQAYRAFLGLDDPVTKNWPQTLKRRARALVATAVDWSDPYAKTTIAGETRTGVHSANVLGGDLHQLLCCDFTASELRQAGNVFAKAAWASELALAQKISESGGELEPADLLKLALEVSNGSYPLAVLSAHNLLKDIALEGRTAIKQGTGASGQKLVSHDLAELQDAAHFVGKLADLREDPSAAKDKIGPWYHAFAILTAGALQAPGAAALIVDAEHTAKLLGFFKGEGGFNAEKYLLDRSILLGVARSAAIEHLSQDRVRP